MSKLSKMIDGLGLGDKIAELVFNLIKGQKIYITIGDKRITMEVTAIEDTGD